MPVTEVHPILRMHDSAATERFYTEFLPGTIDWRDDVDDGPGFWQVTIEGAELWLSSHHDDGTPGSVVVLTVADVHAVYAILDPSYPFFNPCVEDGPGGGLQLQVIDPASNRLRFWQRPG